jgi:RNA polymerase sigma-70 factor, ECF subfamily
VSERHASIGGTAPAAGPLSTLIEEFRAGDPDAVRAVYRRYAGAVHTVARSIVGPDRELCADVVQQTFTKAWQAAHRFDGDRDLAPWLYAIARRTAIDAVRAERRPTRGDHEPETDVGVTTLSFEQTWEAYEVRTTLDGLPPDEREVVRLAHLVGLTHAEVAERLGVPVGTVKSRMHRAHKRLAAGLSHLLPEAPRAPGANRQAPAAVERGEES